MSGWAASVSRSCPPRRWTAERRLPTAGFAWQHNDWRQCPAAAPDGEALCSAACISLRYCPRSAAGMILAAWHLQAAPVGRGNADTKTTTVDVELVLAVDISYSMDPDELALQRDGYAQALTSREFLNALAAGHPRQNRRHLFRMGGRRRSEGRRAVARDRRPGKRRLGRERDFAGTACGARPARRSPARCCLA